MIEWETVQNKDDFLQLENRYPDKWLLFFKHSTTCGLSSMALRQLQASWRPIDQLIPFKIHVQEHRHISNLIEHHFSILHESPQVLLIEQGKCIYHASHWQISFEKIRSAIISSST